SKAQLTRSGKTEADPEVQRLTTVCRELNERKSPPENALLFYRRLHAVRRFQNEELAELIFVKN
ncbi:MAG TPA: hypothetical protein VIJ14_02095, partial [Rhabdochlamydiaceae bacterium]